MTYGVYSEDLSVIKIGEVSLKEARKWLRKGLVICIEKEVTTGFELKLQLHFRPRWCWCKWEPKKSIGFISFEFRRLGYMWADKIVERYKEGVK